MTINEEAMILTYSVQDTVISTAENCQKLSYNEKELLLKKELDNRGFPFNDIPLMQKTIPFADILIKNCFQKHSDPSVGILIFRSIDFLIIASDLMKKCVVLGLDRKEKTE